MWLHWQQLGARPPSHGIGQHDTQPGEHPGNEPTDVVLEDCAKARALCTSDIPTHAERSFINDLATGSDVKEGADIEPSSRTGHSVAFARLVAFSENTWTEPLEQLPTLLLQGMLSQS